MSDLREYDAEYMLNCLRAGKPAYLTFRSAGMSERERLLAVLELWDALRRRAPSSEPVA